MTLDCIIKSTGFQLFYFVSVVLTYCISFMISSNSAYLIIVFTSFSLYCAGITCTKMATKVIWIISSTLVVDPFNKYTKIKHTEAVAQVCKFHVIQKRNSKLVL